MRIFFIFILTTIQINKLLKLQGSFLVVGGGGGGGGGGGRGGGGRGREVGLDWEIPI
ncbi:Uncharacterized protein TCM_001367 [Theobroma cacao]|uniref:Uncharacterized protein n=1 Tax=Theobroma cacao TaxID=3641 RepID=A0A061DII9_THECC|nr:Uncharacterized protein TCM_001367 [Theobroma cacao]